MAREAGLSFRGVQLLESKGHNWRYESLKAIAGAYALPDHGLDYVVERFLSMTVDSVEEVSLRIYLGGQASWRIHFFNFVDQFRRNPDTPLISHPPIEALNPHIKAPFASTVEFLCAEQKLSSPSWTRSIETLELPWFVSGVENLKACALMESPAQFRSRNIFVLGNFLQRT
jgi:hypothetical protein